MSPQKVCQSPKPWCVHVETGVTKLKTWTRDRPGFKVALNPRTTVLRGDRRGTDADTQGEGHRRREAEGGGTGPHSRQDLPTSPELAERLGSGSRSGFRGNPRGGQFGGRPLASTTVRGPVSEVSGHQGVATCYNAPRKGIRHLTPGQSRSTPAALPELPMSSARAHLPPLPFSHGPASVWTWYHLRASAPARSPLEHSSLTHPTARFALCHASIWVRSFLIIWFLKCTLPPGLQCSLPLVLFCFIKFTAI